MLHHFEVFIVIRSVKTKDHVNQEHAIHRIVDDYPICAILLDEGKAVGCNCTSEDQDQRDEDVPLLLPGVLRVDHASLAVNSVLLSSLSGFSGFFILFHARVIVFRAAETEADQVGRIFIFFGGITGLFFLALVLMAMAMAVTIVLLMLGWRVLILVLVLAAVMKLSANGLILIGFQTSDGLRVYVIIFF